MARAVILGVNSTGYNTSSAIVIDGQAVFAVEEERLVREKRTRRFPIVGIREGLNLTGVGFDEIDAVAVAWNPAINLEALSHAQSERARYWGEVFYNVPSNLMNLKQDKSASLSQQILDFVDGTQLKIFYVPHHLAHASTFFYSPFEHAAIMSIDAFGEKDSVLFAEGEDSRLRVLWTQEFPHSLGSFYAAMTEFMGFRPDRDEWKVMGASSYGDSDRYYEKLLNLIVLRDEGGFELDLSFFNHYQFHRPLMYAVKLTELLSLQPNEGNQLLNQDYYDLAAAVQRVTEDIYFHLLNQLHDRTGLVDVVLAGGVVYNSVANGKILEKTPFQRVFIPPVPDDSGGSLGAAFYVLHQEMHQQRSYVLTSNYLGPGYSDAEIQDVLKKYGIEHRILEDPPHTAAEFLASGKIIGWFQGRLEFGDRALGNRSILADPRDASMKDKVNETVKYREPFRPFAPSILEEYIDDYFVNAVPAPFMERVFPIQVEKRQEIPAVTHVNGTGRLHTVSREQNQLYWRLIDEFRMLTGVPVVLNTSFNLKGEPIVCSPHDAVRTFFSSGLDALFIGNCLVQK